MLIDSQPNKKPKKSGGKGSVAFVKTSQQLCCVFQDAEPSKSRSNLRKDTKVLGPKRSVLFSQGTLRHVKILGRKGPSQGVIQHSETDGGCSHARKFEARSQEETLQQERCASRDAWEMSMCTGQSKGQTHILRSFRSLVITSAIFDEIRATVYVYDLDLFVIVQILRDTLAVLSLGKLCEDPGYSYEWAGGRKPHLVCKIV